MYFSATTIQGRKLFTGGNYWLLFIRTFWVRQLKTVPVIFVVNTVLIQYCVYYENYWNSLYDPQYAGINLQSPQSDSTPWILTLFCILVLGEENYENNLNCIWKISAIETKCIELEFIEFEVEYSEYYSDYSYSNIGDYDFTGTVDCR